MGTLAADLHSRRVRALEESRFQSAVSAPISWDELDDPTIKPDRWDMRTIIERVASKGDLFRSVLDDPQELPPLS